MITTFAILFLISFILIGKTLFGKWINHVGLYVSVWVPMILLYDLRLIRYIDLSLQTWFYILAAFFSFLFGVLTIYSANKLNENQNSERKDFLLLNEKWFYDNSKILKVLIFSLSTIGLLTIIQNWYILINAFGSVQMVLLNASLVYKMRVNRTIEGQIPYLFTLSYAAVFFAAVYSSYKNKITVLSVYPFIGVILKEISQSSRAGILNSLSLFAFTFILMKIQMHKKVKTRASRKKLIVGVIFILILLISSVTLVKVTRVTNERFKGATVELRELETGSIISPSIYLYFSAHLGVLEKTLRNVETSKLFAEKTLNILYGVLARISIVKRPIEYDRFYNIPTPVNTGTYIRDLYTDFGALGPIIFPFLLGLLTTFFWYKFQNTSKIIYLLFLVHFYIIITFSFLINAMRLQTWVIPLAISVFIIIIIEKRMKIMTS